MNTDTLLLPVQHTQAPSRGVDRLTNGRKALRHAFRIGLLGYFDEQNRAFLGCCREVERAMLARGQQAPQEAPQYPLATIRAAGRAGPYRLVDDHGSWRQELCFANPQAALLFIQVFRAGGSRGSATNRGADAVGAAGENP